MKIGVVREGKVPPDKRVPFTPQQCAALQLLYPGLQVVVQPSPIRCYFDEEYTAKGIVLQEDLNDCDVLMGIKEVPIGQLIPGKKYLFFSHTIKKQPYNQQLMRALLDKHISMIDYECLTDAHNKRVIGFGRYAGIVGTYNGLLAFGKRTKRFELTPAHACVDKVAMYGELKKCKLEGLRIITTGGGRVAQGVVEVLKAAEIKEVDPIQFMNVDKSKVDQSPIFAQLHSHHYFIPNRGEADDHRGDWDAAHFYAHPYAYTPDFVKYLKNATMLISAHFWDRRSKPYFEKQDVKACLNELEVIADITCDVNGSLPTTLRASTIAAPLYGYHRELGTEVAPFDSDALTVMAVDNLPCELPRDASQDFGMDLIKFVMPQLLGKDEDNRIARATICQSGELTTAFHYLADYANNS